MSEDIESQSNSMRDYMPSEEEITDEDAEAPESEEEQPEIEEEQPSEEPDEAEEEAEEDEPEKEESEEEPKAEKEEPEDSEPKFTEKVNPDELPPELQTVYKQMQGDYTRKTQEIAGLKREAQQYQKYRSLVDYLAKNPQAAQNLIDGMQGKQEAPSDEEIEYPTDPKEYAEFIKQETLKEVAERDRRIQAQREQARLQEQYLTQQTDEARKLDPRLDSDNEFGEIIASMVMQDPLVRAGRKTIVQATKDSIARYDNYFKAQLDAEKKRLSDQAKKKRNVSPPSTKSETGTQKKEPQTMREAYEMSFGKK